MRLVAPQRIGCGIEWAASVVSAEISMRRGVLDRQIARNLTIAALTALVLRATGRDRKRYLWIMAAGLVGAALFYGDGVITPAISVLSAVEGLKVATPLFEPYVIPISLVLLIGIFMVQRQGTAAIGGLFGPVMLVWFAG